VCAIDYVNGSYMCCIHIIGTGKIFTDWSDEQMEYEIINHSCEINWLNFDHYSAAMTKSNGSVSMFLKFVTLIFHATHSSS
jgi:hypothetical protein